MKNVFKKAAIILTAAVCAAALLCGCEKKKEDVKLKTESEAKTYVSKNLPEAEFEKSESGTDEKTFYFKDKECGFKFKVVSKVVKKQFDATVVGYDEKTEDTWSEDYLGYIKDKVSKQANKIAGENGFDCKWEKKIDAEFILTVRTDKAFEDLKQPVKKLGELIKAEDRHNKLGSKQEIRVLPSSGGKLKAYYRFDKNEVLENLEK